MRKQFDLQYYIEHPETKVITRDGRDVKILCSDLRDPNYPIAATYINLSGNGSDIESFTSEGKVFVNASIEHSRDLFFDMPDQYVKKVPLTHEDLQERVKAGKTMWIVRDRDTFCDIVDFDDEAAYYVYGGVKKIFSASYEWMLACGITFADGTPCWKEEVGNDYMYLIVGGTIKCSGETYKCVKKQPRENCADCALYEERDICARTPCDSHDREDKTSVIFKLEEKGGEE